MSMESETIVIKITTVNKIKIIAKTRKIFRIFSRQIKALHPTIPKNLNRPRVIYTPYLGKQKITTTTDSYLEKNFKIPNIKCTPSLRRPRFEIRFKKGNNWKIGLLRGQGYACRRFKLLILSEIINNVFQHDLLTLGADFFVEELSHIGRDSIPPKVLESRSLTSIFSNFSLYVRELSSSLWASRLSSGVNGNSFSLFLKRARNSKQYFAYRFDLTVTLY